ncbi:error-prone DNA polymerase [Stigmatella aurantiaca]|uniref:DNA-directed DNA polymerase n=1 Tax=Stigmatella aurantiaca (strain DW4/3-1) TaxID=378806 RepID=E3FVL8_STIAD|nr:error-prone DNA polymerase [Stigmatella aurantiaca]ADO72232.1 DNA polymerase III, alpha subunit [Stigmatella aurantiaca DW4/3-1]
MYAELVCRSNFSFLRGASHPEELVATAARLGLPALALTDGDGLYGVVKAHLAAREHGLKLILGTELTLTEGPPVVVYAMDAGGYANMCRLVSASRMAHPKGETGLPWREVAERSEGLIALLPHPAPIEQVGGLAEAFPGRFHVGLCRTLSAGDGPREARAEALARELGVPLCAHNDVHVHHRRRQPLQDVLTAIRHKTTVDKAGTRLLPNAERTLKSPAEMARLFRDRPEAIERTLEIAQRCHATLDDLRYHFSEEDLPPGLTAMGHLRQLTEEGLGVRYPAGVPPEVRKQVEHEMRLIEALDFPGYFLALWDIVRFARSRGILCQGRGSAANSVVCYALQLTAIDPVRMGLLFERFLSMERKEPPDIDVDFEHERREEVLQYVYEKHGRHRAGMVCEFICYRGRLALREVGKSLGLSLDQVDRLSKVAAASGFEVTPEVLVEAGLSAFDSRVRQTLTLAREMEGFPRHVSIHVGGFVITREPLVDLIPVENAAMKGRTVIQWEKDDTNALGVLKVDLLALGMLTAVSKCLALIREHFGRELSLATIPPEDPKVYDMLCEADTVGVFQIESRAQMNMLPRLKPRTFYDLVIEIALIRPGPIVGNMVHPYLRRRNGEEVPTYPTPDVQAILEKTLGVPLFQEQAMKLAMVAAGFTAGEADGLRRALGHKRAEQLLEPYRMRFVEGGRKRGYPAAYMEELFAQFRGFAHYGFPESHSASFALIAYASSWLKCHYPQAFTTALLNSQPMGFYAPHTLVADARRHGVEVRPVDVRHSGWDCTLEEGGALRLGLRMVRGLGEAAGKRVAAARAGGFSCLGDVARRTRIPRHELTRLALAGALASLCGSRRQALWEIQALGPLDADDLFFGMSMDGTQVELPPMGVAERVTADYETVGLSLEKHPLELLRPTLRTLGAVSAEGLQRVSSGRRVAVGGMLICRQRPPTARGMCFLSLEDETGIANLVVPPDVYERSRRDIHGALFLVGEGVLERSGKVLNVKALRIHALEGAVG